MMVSVLLIVNSLKCIQFRSHIEKNTTSYCDNMEDSGI